MTTSRNNNSVFDIIFLIFHPRFYICCDRCQDWFHGRCVGIMQSEADHIDEYICPNCTSNSNVNIANMKNLTVKDYETLKKLIKQIQVISYLPCYYILSP